MDAGHSTSCPVDASEVIQEESDSCGELPAGGDPRSPTTGLNSVTRRRCSEYYPATSRAPLSYPASRQTRRDRRLSDPGRLSIPLLRLSLHGDGSANGERGGLNQPGIRLSDPRLAAIRSLFGTGPCEVGEALTAATGTGPCSPPLCRRSSRSRSPTLASETTPRHARWDTRRLSLPNPPPLSIGGRPCGGGGAGPTWLPTEMGEAMGAVSGSPFPTGSPPPRPAAFGGVGVSCSLQATSAAAAALRRRRSVSLDQSSRLEAISEENSSLAAAKAFARKCSTPTGVSSD